MSCLLLLLHLCKMFHYYFVFLIKMWQTIWHCCSSLDNSRVHPSRCVHFITTADQDLPTIAALDKWVRGGVGQVTLLLICSPDFMSKERYQSCYRQKEHQLLLDTVLFYDVLKGTAGYYVCLELRKESDSCYICSGCRPLNFEVTN